MKENKENQAIFDTTNLPDFIIIGAMKSGTTSIHHILASHNDVFIPDKELYFFDVDDIDQHPDFFVNTSSGWTFHDFEKDFDQYLKWYRNFFKEAVPGQLIGEDTTTYLASKLAPARIKRLLPKVKLIVMLRDPVTRAHSHYWHNVTAGRSLDTIENTLQFSPGNLYERGCYFEQLQRYESFIKAGTLKVVFFEEFIRDNQTVIDDLCRFLNLDGSVDVSQVETHQNAARAPVSLPLRLIGNRIWTAAVRSRKSFRNIPNMPEFSPDGPNLGKPNRSRVAAAYELLMERLPNRPYPPLKPNTQEFLQNLFKKKNVGLSELIGRDVSEFWGYM